MINRLVDYFFGVVDDYLNAVVILSVIVAPYQEQTNTAYQSLKYERLIATTYDWSFASEQSPREEVLSIAADYQWPSSVVVLSARSQRG